MWQKTLLGAPLANLVGWGVVEPAVLRPAEGTLLHAPRSVEQGLLRGGAEKAHLPACLLPLLGPWILE